MTLPEVVIALAVLSAAMLAVVKLVGVAAGQRRLAEQRRVALQEIANEAERLAVVPWDELAPDKLKGWTPSPELTAVLPTASCQAEVSEPAGAPISRQIRLAVTWQNAAGQEVKPVELTVWRFQRKEGP
jgi:Tfp pilus assembly protein PilV